MTTEPMVRVMSVKCSECGRVSVEGFNDGGIHLTYPFIRRASEIRIWVEGPMPCKVAFGGCGKVTRWLFATEPV